MGPGLAGSSDLPSRSRFSWDIRNVPWTDGKGNQEEYANSVALWRTFHDKLPDGNNSKIPKDLQGIMLQSQLYGRAKDLVRKIDPAVLQSESSVEAIMNAVYKRDALAVVSEVYQGFIDLLNTKRGQSESFKNFESRFEARVSKFNSQSSLSKLPDALVAFILLANSNVDSDQRISILAASAPRDSDFNNQSTTDEFLTSVSYGSIASVIRQCDKANNSETQSVPTKMSASSVMRPPRQRKMLRPEQLADLKSKSKCRSCSNYGHWASDHNSDGSLKPGVTSRSQPLQKSDDSSKSNASQSNEKKAISFHMATLQSTDEYFSESVGPLLDDGAPYSGIGLDEFKLIQPFLVPDWSGTFDPLPDTVIDRPYWQYGTGAHSSDVRKIVGSVFFFATSDHGYPIKIKHLIIEGSSQWVIGRNVTKYCDIIRIGGNALKLPVENNGSGATFISLVDHDLHCYIPHEVFHPRNLRLKPSENNTMFCATAMVHRAEIDRPWSATKAILDKVHHHVCGHSSFSDIKVLLQRNGLWSCDVEKYLCQVLETCTSCKRTSEPKPPRKVSLSSLNRSFNRDVCIDHFHLGDNIVFHAMDATARFSGGGIVADTSTMNSIISFETHWVTPFWIPDTVFFDPAFNNDIFLSYLRKCGIEPRSLPPRRHNKNVLESKHTILRDIYLRLKSANESCDDTQEALLVQQVFRISNDLYGNDVMSAHELAKGYTRPIAPCAFPAEVPDELIDAHEKLLSKRKLTLILRSKATKDTAIHTGDLVQVFIKQQHEKRGKWSAPKPVLSYDPDSRCVTVPGKNGRTVRAAIEDVRTAVPDSELARAVQEAIDTLNVSLDEALDAVLDDDGDTSSKVGFDNSNADFNMANDETFDGTGTDATDIGDDDAKLPAVGDAIEVFWPDDDKYYPGIVSEVFHDDGKYHISCNDGDNEFLNLDDEKWRLITNSYRDDSLKSNKVQITPGTELSSTEKEATELYYQMFQSKEFTLHYAQGLPSYITHNAYIKEEDSFKKTVREVPVSQVPRNANIITSHVIYKVKISDDGTYFMKARIAPHGNQDKERETLKTDSATCPPVGIRVLLSIAVLFKWHIAKIDFSTAFLQTGKAMRDVYVVPPRECSTRTRFYWVLLAAAYGLVNTNAKWQETSDNFLDSLGFVQLVYVPQLFFKKVSKELSIMGVMVVDDILFAAPLPLLQVTIKDISKQYDLGTILYGPGTFKFFGLTICQEIDLSISIDGDEKLLARESYPIDRTRRRQTESALNAVEMSTFRSVNNWLGWLGVDAFPFCSFASSYMQQKTPNATVHDLVTQINVLKTLKKLGSTIRFKRPTSTKPLAVSILSFADASRSCDHGQLGCISGLLLGEIKNGSIFHTLSWQSRKSKRPVKSIGSAEFLATGAAIDEGKVLVKAYETLMDVQVDLINVLDSKDLLDTISTCRMATDRSIRGDFALIRYEFETRQVTRMVWLSGKQNLADPLNKPNSPPCLPLQLLMFSGELPCEFTDSKIRNSQQLTG